jgi:transcriptional regulator with XRE-family HTH domain
MSRRKEESDASRWRRHMKRRLKLSDYPREIEWTRAQFGWNQAQLARILGVTQATISGWERGEFPPSSEAFLKLGNIAHPRSAWFFWELAGFDRKQLLRAMGLLLKDADVSATPEQAAKIPELDWLRFEGSEISIAQASRITRLSEQAIIKLLKSGKLKGRRIGASADAYLVGYASLIDYEIERGAPTAQIVLDIRSGRTEP